MFVSLAWNFLSFANVCLFFSLTSGDNVDVDWPVRHSPTFNLLSLSEPCMMLRRNIGHSSNSAGNTHPGSFEMSMYINFICWLHCSISHPGASSALSPIVYTHVCAFYFVLIITIPLIVAVSTIILLFYLKRLKILILPPIPDPREILKRMFGEQNEDSQSGTKDDSVNAYNRLIKEEEIHSLVLTEPLECSYSENENR